MMRLTIAGRSIGEVAADALAIGVLLFIGLVVQTLTQLSCGSGSCFHSLPQYLRELPSLMWIALVGDVLMLLFPLACLALFGAAYGAWRLVRRRLRLAPR